MLLFAGKHFFIFLLLRTAHRKQNSCGLFEKQGISCSGHNGKEKDGESQVYQNEQKLLDKMPVGFPATKSGSEIILSFVAFVRSITQAKLLD